MPSCWFTHPDACVYVVQMRLYILSTTHTHTTHTHKTLIITAHPYVRLPLNPLNCEWTSGPLVTMKCSTPCLTGARVKLGVMMSGNAESNMSYWSVEFAMRCLGIGWAQWNGKGQLGESLSGENLLPTEGEKPQRW